MKIKSNQKGAGLPFLYLKLSQLADLSASAGLQKETSCF